MQRSESSGTMAGDRYEGMMAGDPEQESMREEGGMLTQTKEKVMSTAEPVMEKVSSGAEAGKEKAATGMESAAEALRSRVGGDGALATVGTRAADSLEKTAHYIREHETQELWSDVQEYVRQHPGTALIGALAAGFVISRVLR